MLGVTVNNNNSNNNNNNNKNKLIKKMNKRIINENKACFPNLTLIISQILCKTKLRIYKSLIR